MFDKTGTLTVGRPVVAFVHATDDVDVRALLGLTASLESTSEHHLGRAIAAEAKSRRMPLSPDLADVEVVPGLGLQARVDGHVVMAGRAGLLSERGVVTEKHALQKGTQLEQRGATVVHVAVDGRHVGLIGIADEVRDEAASAIAQLRGGGIRHIAMLTGTTSTRLAWWPDGSASTRCTLDCCRPTRQASS